MTTTIYRKNASDFLTGGSLGENVIVTDRIAGGNYKLVNIESLHGSYNDEIVNTITHETGIHADINARLQVQGYCESIEQLANIATYCKFKSWYIEINGLDYSISGGIANKFHGMTSLIKILNKYSKIEFITADIFDSNNNNYLFTSNLKGVDAVKTLQKLDRGFLVKLQTDRPDFIAVK